MSLTPFIQHLQNAPLRGLAEQLQRVIGSDNEHGPCVYFAASYEKLRRIAATGAILPRNAVQDLPAETEISATGVQARRKEVFLGDGHRRSQPKETHDCLNFFFNPYNSTLFAFARNQLIIGGLPLELGILEIPLERISGLLHQRRGGWACSKQNIATGGYTSGLFSQITGEWPWAAILDGSDDHQAEQARAAEFLLWMQGGRSSCSSGLPVDTVSRVLIPEGSPLDAFDNCPHVVFHKIPETQALLGYEKHLQNFDRFAPFGLFPLLAGFQTAVSQLPIQLELQSFATPHLAASDLHGIPHVSRVMLWTHYLSQPTLLQLIGEDANVYENLAGDALLAAAIHDLQRQTDSEDDQHGENAAEHYSALITAHCSNDPVRVSRIKSAVTWHCRDDALCPEPDNLVFKILKDADALDRGRFAGPCEGTNFQGQGCNSQYCKRHSGCAHKTLRLRYERIPTNNADWPFRKNLAMAAWNLARATSTAPWDFNSPSQFLERWLQLGQERLEDDFPSQSLRESKAAKSTEQVKISSVIPAKVPTPEGATEPHFVIDSQTIVYVGTWIDHSTYGIGRVLKINTRPDNANSHRVWFARNNTVLASHPLTRIETMVIPEDRVPAEVRATCPKPPWY
jgi:hypothetical protein